MNGCFTTGTGGALRLKTVLAESYDALPEVKDGRIGLVGTVKPARVWVQNEQPSSPKEGDLWMLTTEKSSTPIQVKEITLYPTRFLQYLSGVWYAAEAYVRYGGMWAAPVLWLYSEGEQYAAASGGWAGASNGGSVQISTMHAGKSALGLVAGTGDKAAVYTKKSLSAGLYSELCVTFYKDDDNGILEIGLSEAETSDEPETVLYRTLERQREYVTARISLKSLPKTETGKIKIQVEGPGNNQTEYVYVRDVYLTN